MVRLVGGTIDVVVVLLLLGWCGAVEHMDAVIDKGREKYRAHAYRSAAGSPMHRSSEVRGFGNECSIHGRAVRWSVNTLLHHDES